MSKKRKPNYFIPVAIVAGLGLAVYTSSKTWKMAMQEKEKANSMRTELDATQKSNVKLREKNQILNPVQKEEEARRLGYVLPDEKSLPAKAPSTTPDISEPAVNKLPPKEKSEPPIDLHDGDRNDPPKDLR